MTRPLSPIERMIDAACGYDRDNPPAPPPWKGPVLECPQCKKSQPTVLDRSDPKGTKRVVVKCPECFQEGGFETIRYFDKSGKELQP